MPILKSHMNQTNQHFIQTKGFLQSLLKLFVYTDHKYLFLVKQM